jgi:anti-anti-sigma regulatory factor
MASNFHIFRHRTKDTLYLKLEGDFDGSSALELINTLEENGVGFRQILIDTNELKTIYPFGRKVFQKNLGRFNKKGCPPIFIGENEHNIAQ